MESSNHFKSIREINDTIYLEYFGTRERLKNDTYTLDNNVPIKTGLKQLDSIIGPIPSDSLYVIGGRPAMGKTSLMIDIALNMAKYKPIYIFYLESDAEYIAKRILSKMSDIDLITLGDKPLKNDEKERIKKCIEALDKYNIYVCENVLDSNKISEIIESEARDGIVFIDYLQLMDTGLENYNNRAIITGVRPKYSRQNEIADGFKNLVKKCNIPVIVLSQLNRSVEKRKNKRPTLDEIRYNKHIAESADTVIFIYRKAYYSYEDKSKEAELIVAKNNRGKTGTAIVQFDNRIGKFFE